MIKCISCIIGYPLIFDIIIYVYIYIYSQYTCCDVRAHTAYSTLQYVLPIQILVQVGIITLARPFFCKGPAKGCVYLVSETQHMPLFNFRSTLMISKGGRIVGNRIFSPEPTIC